MLWEGVIIGPKENLIGIKDFNENNYQWKYKNNNRTCKVLAINIFKMFCKIELGLVVFEGTRDTRKRVPNIMAALKKKESFVKLIGRDHVF